MEPNEEVSREHAIDLYKWAQKHMANREGDLLLARLIVQIESLPGSAVPRRGSD